MTRPEFSNIWYRYLKRFGEVWNDKTRTNSVFEEWWASFREEMHQDILDKATTLLFREWPDNRWPVQADVWCYYERVRHDQLFRSSEEKLTDDQERIARQIERLDHEIFILSPEEKDSLQEEAREIAFEEFQDKEPDHKPYRHLNHFQVHHISQLMLPVLARHRVQFWMRKLFAERNGMEFGRIGS